MRWMFKKLSTGEGPGEMGEVQLQYLLGYPGILLWYPSNNHTFMPSIGSWSLIINFYIIHVIKTTLLKSDLKVYFF